MDKLMESDTTRAQLVTMLRAAQAQRDDLAVENGKLDSRLTCAEIAINTAIQEDRAPVWPPGASRPQSTTKTRQQASILP